MGKEENLEAAKAGYAAFGRGDAAGAMENLSDDIEWVVAGRSTISGTYRGKQEVGQLWGKLAEKGFQINPQRWFADDEMVVVLTHVTIQGEESNSADALTFEGGKVVLFESAGDTAMQERVFGSK